MESTTTDAAVTQQYGNETWTLPQQPALDLGVHRHWKAAASVKFLSSVAHIDDIHETREDKQRTVFYRLDIYLRHPTTPSVSSSNVLRSPDSEIERSFSDFEALRGAVFDAASIMPQCRCKYCMEVLLYIRYKFDRPRSIVKFVAGTEKRKQIFAQFINDSVEMGRRRVQKAGKFECKAQTPRTNYAARGFLQRSPISVALLVEYTVRTNKEIQRVCVFSLVFYFEVSFSEALLTVCPSSGQTATMTAPFVVLVVIGVKILHPAAVSHAISLLITI
ncbi:hypothetical protein PC128_g4916 [Phytophthora cactorum]|nr:hypothetical protein PC128_g4916 [Phytophthora cactorum]